MKNTELISKIYVVQKDWANRIVQIGKMNRDGVPREEIEKFTDQFLKDLYVFGDGQEHILFKPTKAVREPFRIDQKDTRSYFIGGAVREDQGFALKPWESVEFSHNKHFHVKETSDGIDVMGEYSFVDYTGNRTIVQYTFGYVEINNNLKIRLHHSSLPFQSKSNLKLNLEINGSIHEGARYIGWKPIKCTLHFNAESGNRVQGAQVKITSKNNGTGRVVFLENEKDSEQQETLTFEKVRENKVDFYVAGKFGHPSKEDKDTVISIELSGVGVSSENHERQRFNLEVPIMIRVRKNAESLDSIERDRLLSGLVKLTQKRPKKEYPSDLTYTQVPHSLFDELVLMHTLDAAYEIHGRTSFYPWHRIFLLHLERELQEIDPAITIPYWKYDEKAPNLFSDDFAGKTNRTSQPQYSIKEVLQPTFSDSNPMKNWKTVWDPLTRGYFRENPAKSPNYYIMSDPCLLQSASNFKEWCEIGEGKSHNPGHTTFNGRVVDIGKDPVDPVFFFLHVNVDRLWAKWQKKYNRFDANDIETYPYQGKKETREKYDEGYMEQQIGNYVDDTLWPWNWDNEFPRPIRRWERGAEADNYGIVPDINIAFPTSEFFHSPTSPTVRDTVDYRGELDHKVNLGFDYDDIPYFESDLEEQMKSEKQCVLVADGIKQFSQTVRAVKDRLKAVENQPPLNSMEHLLVLNIFKDDREPVEIRIEAINLIFNHDDVFLDSCLSIMGNKEEDPLIVIEAIHQVRASKRSSIYYGSRKSAFFNLLRGLLKSRNVEIRNLAIEILSIHGDPVVQDFLKEKLNQEEVDDTDVVDALFFLSFDHKNEHLSIFKEQLEKTESAKIKAAAAEALGGDLSSQNFLLKTLENENEPEEVRIACIDSLYRLQSENANENAVNLIKKMGTGEMVLSEKLTIRLLNMINFTGNIDEIKNDEAFTQSLSSLRSSKEESADIKGFDASVSEEGAFLSLKNSLLKKLQ